MTAERVRPLAAFALVSLLCTLIMVASMSNHPVIVAHTTEGPTSQAAPSTVVFGQVLAPRPGVAGDTGTTTGATLRDAVERATPSEATAVVTVSAVLHVARSRAVPRAERHASHHSHSRATRHPAKHATGIVPVLWIGHSHAAPRGWGHLFTHGVARSRAAAVVRADRYERLMSQMLARIRSAAKAHQQRHADFGRGHGHGRGHHK